MNDRNVTIFDPRVETAFFAGQVAANDNGGIDILNAFIQGAGIAPGEVAFVVRLHPTPPPTSAHWRIGPDAPAEAYVEPVSIQANDRPELLARPVPTFPAQPGMIRVALYLDDAKAVEAFLQLIEIPTVPDDLSGI